MVDSAVETSSIGPKWPPQETSFNRVKGFYDDRIIVEEGQFDNLLAEVAYIARFIGSTEVTRLSIRAIVDNSLLHYGNPALEAFGEAVISLDGTNPDFRETSILYLGYNSADRQPDKKDLVSTFDNYRKAKERRSKDTYSMLLRAETQGYEIRMLATPVVDEKIVAQVAELYGRFGWDLVQVEEILSNPLNCITLAFCEDQIVSAGISEFSLIQIKNGREGSEVQLKMVELTEAATLSEHGGKGLYSAISSKSLLELQSGSVHFAPSGIDLAYGECNGSNLGVLLAAKTQGRIFSTEISESKSLPFRGLLPQHVPISGSQRSTEYNDLIPAFISRHGLLKFVECHE